MAASSSDMRKGSSEKSAKEKLAVRIILAREGLEEYYPYFEKAGIKMLSATNNLSDIQVEQLLTDAERANSIVFLPDTRVDLWKALRYNWFRGPSHDVKFIERSTVPSLFLPKADYKEVDWNVKLADVDPDRSRQFVRKSKPSDAPAFRGPAVITYQFEVYKRQMDIVYEFKDIERSVAEWQMRDPKTMLREDTREEVIKLRIRNLEDNVHALLAELKSQSFAICRWWSRDPRIAKLDSLLYKCQWQVESISDFRVETEHLRINPAEDFDKRWLFKARKARSMAKKKKHKGKKKHNQKSDLDASVTLWTHGEEDVQDTNKPPEVRAAENLANIQRSIDESFKRLPHLHMDLRHRGGNRMVKFAGKMGMPQGYEDKLRVRLPHVPEAHNGSGFAALRDDEDDPLVHTLPPSPSLPPPPGPWG